MSESIKITESTLILSISVLHPDIEPDVYEATRYAWRLNANRAKRYKLVLARCGDLVVGAFRPTKWMKATKENFPEKTPSVEYSGKFEDRWGFESYCCKADRDLYLGKRVPSRYRGQNPVRYCEPV